MTTGDSERALRARVRAAVRALPEPDPGRLARIEQGLPVHARGRRSHVPRWVLAAAVGAAAAMAGAGLWLARAPEDPEEPPQRQQPSAQPEASGPARTRQGDGAHRGDGNDAPGGDDPVIYQR